MESMEFGARLRQLRNRAGLSQRKLADRVGIDYSYLSKIENGVIPPPSEQVIRRLAEVLDADGGELLRLAGKITGDVSSMLKKRGAMRVLRAYNTISEVPRMIKMKNIRKVGKIATPIVLVIAVAASLLFAAPLPAEALSITVTNTSGGAVLPTAYLGTEYALKVIINVEDMDVLPIVRVDVRIVKAGDPTRKATLRNLPLCAVSKRAHPLVEGVASGTAAVASEVGTYWGYGYARRTGYGYGYGYGVGWGYMYPPSLFGYGYSGYGYGTYRGATSITYTVYWTPPTCTTWAGTYKVQPIVYTQGSNLGSAFTVPTIPTFTVSQIGGAAAPQQPQEVEPGVWDVSDVVTSSGTFTNDVTLQSDDNRVSLTIPSGTVGLTADVQPLSQISLTPSASPADPPAGSYLIGGLVYEIGPTGATFDPPITLTFTYDPADLPAGMSEDDLTIAVYNEATGGWDELTVTIDPATNTVSVTLAHLSKYAVMTRFVAATPTPTPVTPEEEEAVVTEEPEEEAVVEEEEAVVEEEEEVTPTPTPTPTPEPEPTGIAWWVWLIIGIAVVAAVVLVYFYWWRRRTA